MNRYFIPVLLALASWSGCASPRILHQDGLSVPSTTAKTERRRPHIFADLALGAGSYEHETKGSNLDDTTAGGFFRLRGEVVGAALLGGGIALEGAASDDDLFLNDGFVGAEGSLSDLYLYLLAVPVDSEQWRVALRGGLYVHNMSLEEDTTALDVDWQSVGLRVAVEPELWLARGASASLAAVTSLALGVHTTEIDYSDVDGSESFDTRGSTVGFSLGLRALFSDHVSVSLEYVSRVAKQEESDAELGVTIREATGSFDGFLVQLGVQF